MAYVKGIAFIVEGATEKVFYLEYLRFCCSARSYTVSKIEESLEDAYLVCHNGQEMLVMFKNVNSVSQMPNSSIWFQRACANDHPEIEWLVFLCYDTDTYSCPITKFHEGDWEKLREDINMYAESITDLAAEADIEDVILCDYKSVLAFLGLRKDYPMPEGKKGKTKLKKLHRAAAENKAYHPGEKAKPLIQALDMSVIRENAPIPLAAIEEALDFD